MEVRNIMTTPARTCTPEMNLAQIAEVMKESGSGVMPVVNPHGKVVGILTDRDICMTLATRRRNAWSVLVHEAMTSHVHATRPDTDLRVALAIMRKEKVRRLPIIDGDGKLQGLLSMDDILVHGNPGSEELPIEDVVSAYRAFVEPKSLVEVDIE